MKKILAAVAVLWLGSTVPAAAFNVILMFEGQAEVQVYGKSGQLLATSATFEPFYRDGRKVRVVKYPKLTGADISKVCRTRPGFPIDCYTLKKASSGHVFFRW